MLVIQAIPGVAGREVWTDGQRLHITKQIVLSGNYTTGGENLSLAINNVKTSTVPYYVDVQGLTGAYTYKFIPGSNLTNGHLKVFNGTSEIASGAYPANVVADVITFYGITLSMQ